jgi:predicted PurR-regulated permease PerM
MGIALGLFVGLLNMVPYLQTIGLLPSAFFALMYSLQTGTSFWVMMGLVLLVFAVVQLIQDMILVPRIMGDVTGMNPAVILLSLSIWGKLLGILGLIVALPFTFLLLAYYQRFLRRVEQQESA